MSDALKQHWPEYLIEGACLGLFMISAFSFGTILEHQASPIHQAIPNSMLRRFVMGLAMGGTAIAIIYSPIGRRIFHENKTVGGTNMLVGADLRFGLLWRRPRRSGRTNRAPGQVAAGWQLILSRIAARIFEGAKDI